MLKIFKNLQKGTFLRRPNRFLIECQVDGRTVLAHLPNPGRLLELLFPGAVLYLDMGASAAEVSRKTSCTAVAVERDGMPVLLHTHHTNTAARQLLERGLVPGLENYSVEKAEFSVGRSRFDFLLKKGRSTMLLEVKSCTLFGERIAMFPDAVTARGARHLIELDELARSGQATGVLFIVHWPRADFFLPDFHTDLHFAKTLLAVRKDLIVKAMSVRWAKDLTLSAKVHEATIPWNLLKREGRDGGSYMVVLRLSEDTDIPVGSLGRIHFRKGYYMYVGSAKTHLSRRVERHRRLRKKLFWHIDHLRRHADFIQALPVRSKDFLECPLAGALGDIADWQVPAFGSSDCSCPTHLFGMKDNPLLSPPFIKMLLYFRIDRLTALLPKS